MLFCFRARFVPVYFRNCILWIRSDSATPAGGPTISGWADKSGSGNDWTQPVAANQVSYVAGAYNGRATLRGNDATDFIQTVSGAGVAFGPAATIFFAMKQGTTATNFMAINSASTAGILSRFTGALIEWYNGSGADRFTFADTPVGLHVMTARQTDGVALQGWWDGTSAFGPVVPTTALSNYISLFGRTTATNGSADEDIPEVVIYNRALSDSERRWVEHYFGGYYNVPVAA